MTELQYNHLLDENFSVEVAYWEANKEALTRQHPSKYLIIRGGQVCYVLDDPNALRIAEEQDLADNPALVRFTYYEEEPVFSPFSQAAISA